MFGELAWAAPAATTKLYCRRRAVFVKSQLRKRASAQDDLLSRATRHNFQEANHPE